jgi:hypothetical protein
MSFFSEGHLIAHVSGASLRTAHVWSGGAHVFRHHLAHAFFYHLLLIRGLLHNNLPVRDRLTLPSVHLAFLVVEVLIAIRRL